MLCDAGSITCYYYYQLNIISLQQSICTSTSIITVCFLLSEHSHQLSRCQGMLYYRLNIYAIKQAASYCSCQEIMQYSKYHNILSYQSKHYKQEYTCCGSVLNDSMRIRAHQILLECLGVNMLHYLGLTNIMKQHNALPCTRILKLFMPN